MIESIDAATTVPAASTSELPSANANDVTTFNIAAGDSQDALQNAINNASEGDVILLESGTHNISGVDIGSDITIRGEEGALVSGARQGENGANADFAFRINGDGNNGGASGASIENIGITDFANFGVNANGASNLTFDELTVSNIGVAEGEFDTNAQRNTGIQVNGFDASANPDGNTANPVENISITDSVFENIARKGVGVNNAENVVIDNLEISGINTGSEKHATNDDAGGIKVFDLLGSQITNNTVTNSDAVGIWSDLSYGSTIAENTVSDLGLNGFDANDPNSGIRGIYVEKSPASVVENNDIQTSENITALDFTLFSNLTATSQAGNAASSVDNESQDFWSSSDEVGIIGNPSLSFENYSDAFNNGELLSSEDSRNLSLTTAPFFND